MKPASFLAATAVVALLGFATPASATHVSCGATITASTTLDSDVECPQFTEAGLVIGADNVTLNLGGYAIRAVQPPGELGGFAGIVENSSGGAVSGVQIRGGGSRTGTIEGFDHGVLLRASDSRVSGLTITARVDGIDLTGDRNSALLNVIEVTGTVDAVDGEAGLSFGGNNAYATRNTIRGGYEGILTYSGNNPRIVVNTIEGCLASGIDLVGYTDFAMVAKNTVTGCNTGIFVRPEIPPATGGARVQRNAANGNLFGIFVDDPAAFVWCNTANDNRNISGDGDGIDIVGVPGTTVQNNTANNNGQYGIYAEEGMIDGGGNTATGNGFVDCFNVSCGPPPDPSCAPAGA